MKKGIWYYLKTGFKLMLIGWITLAIVMIPMMFIIGFQMFNVLATGDTNNIGVNGYLTLILMPVAWTLNGYFVDKFKNWIFK